MFRLLEKALIPINWLHQHAFCEYQFFLEKIRKIKIKPSFGMLAGISSHQKLFQEFVEQATEIEGTMEEHIQKLLRKEVAPFLVREFAIKSETFGIKGRIDEITLFPDKAIIIDFKPKTVAFEADKIQARAYALSFSDSFQWQKEIFSGIQSTTTGKIVLMEKFGEQAKQETIERIDRLKMQLDGKMDFLPTSNPRQCIACRFENLCGHSLAE